MQETFIRDDASKALVNTDNLAFNRYKAERENQKKAIKLEQRVCSLEEEILTIKSLINDVKEYCNACRK